MNANVKQIYPEKVKRVGDHRIDVTLDDGTVLSFARGWSDIWVSLLEAAWDEPLGTEVDASEAVKRFYDARKTSA